MGCLLGVSLLRDMKARSCRDRYGLVALWGHVVCCNLTRSLGLLSWQLTSNMEILGTELVLLTRALKVASGPAPKAVKVCEVSL